MTLSPIILQKLPKYRAMVGHHHRVPFYLDHTILPNLPVSIVALDLGRLHDGVAADPHTHDTPEVYLLPDYPIPVKVLITVGELTQVVTSPAVCWIPAGAIHQFRVLKARQGQFIFGIFPENTDEDKGDKP